MSPSRCGSPRWGRGTSEATPGGSVGTGLRGLRLCPRPVCLEGSVVTLIPVQIGTSASVLWAGTVRGHGKRWDWARLGFPPGDGAGVRSPTSASSPSSCELGAARTACRPWRPVSICFSFDSLSLRPGGHGEFMGEDFYAPSHIPKLHPTSQSVCVSFEAPSVPKQDRACARTPGKGEVPAKTQRGEQARSTDASSGPPPARAPA